ncbi:hypothetical protein [Pseudonocardia sp. H11422]|uniref:hypothetical protein n=1 Tax=Pseudonocardia sp. H11422 TaxID=2835866 RepID=UPI001BDC1543|nr:hypothetical protein [Pseudonocardia sp. H11422]
MSVRPVSTVLAETRRGHPGLFGLAVAMAVLAAVLAILLPLDDRVLLGAPIWLKPLKFALSIALYAAALSWMLARIDLPGRGARRSGWVISVAATVEMVIIVGQAARGVRSHFNDSTTFDIALFALMGATIVVLWLATLGIALRFLRRSGPDPATTWAVRSGIAVSLLGMAVGFLMIGADGHVVGAPEDSPGLAFVGWSSLGGDLRIGHFIGMHALQVLPLLAAALAVVPRRLLDDGARVRLIGVAAAGYTATTLLLTWQALRGQPLLAPDATTLVAAGLLVAAVTIAVAVVLAGAGAPAGGESVPEPHPAPTTVSTAPAP